MRIVINTSDENLAAVEELLLLLTNYAQIDVNRVVYNQEEMWAEIPLSRRVVDFKATLFGKRPKYRKETRQSILRIEHVENFQIHAEKHLFEEFNGIFTVLFGMKIDGRTIYFCSAEENQGKHMGEIVVYVSSIDIEITDIS